MVIAPQGFLCVKPCASDSSCSVVDRQMEVPGLARDPFVGGSVHLLHFAEISASGAPGVGIFDCHKIGLDGIGFLFGRSIFFFDKEFFFDPFFPGFRNSGRKDRFCFQYFGYGRRRNTDVLALFKEFRIMPKVCLVIFVTVKIYNRIAGFFRYRSSRLAAPVAMDKEGLALSAVSGKHTVNMAFGTAQSQGSAVLVSIGMVRQCFNYFIFLLFVH